MAGSGIDAAIAMRAMFALDARAQARVVVALLDALAELLTGGNQKH